MSQRTLYIFGIVLIAVLSVSIAAAIDWLGNVNSASEFYVGVEFAYDKSSGNSGELLGYLKAMVDKVKDYTNLFVIAPLR